MTEEEAIWNIHKIVLNNLEDYCDSEEEKLLLLDILGDMIKSVQTTKGVENDRRRIDRNSK